MNEGYKELAAAIIKQCLWDYREALRSHDIISTLECEQFLRSEWFAFMSDMNGSGINDMPRTVSPDRSKMEGTVFKIMALEQDIQDTQAEYDVLLANDC